MTLFAIMREPRKRPTDPHGWRRPRRMATIDAKTPEEALRRYVRATYIETGNQQYAGHHLSGRTRAVVTLANGRRNIHDLVLHAWRVER